MEKKNFLIPELMIVLFADEDIIMTSANGPTGDGNGEEGETPFPFNP